MAELTIDRTYGSALYQAAVETDKKDLILDEACQVLGIFEQETDFYTFVNYPAISVKEKKAVLKNVFQGRICQELLNFLYILADKGRTYHFPKIVKAYQEMVNQDEGFSSGTVYSVEPLKPEQLARLEEETASLLQKKVKLENKLDAKLMGGVKILIDGRIIDASIRKRFENLSSQLI